MAKKSDKPGGTHRMLQAGEKWPKCETCGRLLWVRPRKEGNPAMIAQCSIHAGAIHLETPQAEPKPGEELSRENMEVK